MTTPGPTVVSIIEDHPLFREILRQIVEQDPQLRAGALADSVETFLRSGAQPAGVVVMDLALPGLSGADAVRTLASAGHRVLMMSASERAEHMLGALDAGASGYLSKSAEADQVRWAIHRVAEGSSYVAPHLAASILEHRHRARPKDALHSLTSREREVLALVADGFTDQEIARRLTIGLRTVRSHLDHIRAKTGRRRRAELTRLAVDEGLVSQD